MLAMEAGGVDVIELGIPFSEPSADGPVIRECHEVALWYKVDFKMCLKFISEARLKGPWTRVTERAEEKKNINEGYYNSVFSYGEQAAVVEAKEAGANGFLITDLPFEEAFQFQVLCARSGLSYVPLIAPNTSDSRIRLLASKADSFIYLGPTGARSQVASSLPELVTRIRKLAVRAGGIPIPLVVGFGISTAAQFDYVGRLGNGVVVGSKLIEVVNSKRIPIDALTKFCEEICGRRRPIASTPSSPPNPPTATAPDSLVNARPGRFGIFGGRYLPEAFIGSLLELESCYRQAMADPKFQAELRSHYSYLNRPSELYFAQRLSAHVGGAKIWLKREDLTLTGSHKINNVLGQILLARRLGKTHIVAECAAGHHGLATATLCKKFALKCSIFIGEEDLRRRPDSVRKIENLGAKVVIVTSGNKKLKDAINDAMSAWASDFDSTHYLIGSAIGPHPYPTIVRDFQRVIGEEIQEQLQARQGRLPDAVVACVGGGSNAIGAFHPFIEQPSVRLVGVEAGGTGIDEEQHSASLTKGTRGIFHGALTYVLQDQAGKICTSHSISAGLDYPAVGPELAWLKETGRAEFCSATDFEAIQGIKICAEFEDFLPSIEAAHAVNRTIQVAKELGKAADVVLCLSGRGEPNFEGVLSQT
ncbi:tryptophan synthetase [Puccinia graminis f. sp. tritici]|uniref:Tryptophan synthase n=1 Tax=Puccinia graminis f. sp. tritici TaxID=56615 RepID=A0A5B0MR91_PUCGR|nr:tryptophan synthetase [Puccinia graminis f. sp. tritici]